MNAIRYQIATQLKSDVSVEDAKLALAQVCLGQNAPLKARRWGRDVARGGVEPWARQAEEMLTKMPPICWSDALGGGTLA